MFTHAHIRMLVYPLTQTDRQTDRESDRQTDRQTDRHSLTHSQTHRHTDTHTHAHAHTHTQTALYLKPLSILRSLPKPTNLSTCLLTNQCIPLLACLSVRRSIHRSICLSVYKSMHTCIYINYIHHVYLFMCSLSFDDLYPEQAGSVVLNKWRASSGTYVSTFHYDLDTHTILGRWTITTSSVSVEYERTPSFIFIGSTLSNAKVS